jgi:phosphate starvation-inducible protein PhoH and related proteins
MVIQRLISIAMRGDLITKQNVTYLMQLANEDQLEKADDYLVDFISLTARGKQIKAKTHGQKRYVDAIKGNDIVFGIGPAGTGKTFLAVAMAVNAFRNKEVNRIILTRPAVEAGEKLGFLPGDLQNKVDPYLRPLYDALYEIMGAETYLKYLEKSMIEIAPLAYMRGRTLDDAFIILDEAQNTTPEQMKMFLTRIGFGSKVVVTGDVTQIDLPGDKKSGLKEVVKVLKDIKGIEFIHLTDQDVVRHELIQRIIKAYEKYDSQKEPIRG